jgi:DNA-binding MarR family transcriptional regulator
MKKVKREKVEREVVESKHKAFRQNTIAAADRLHSAAIHLLRRVRLQDVASGEGPARLSALSVLVFSRPEIGSPKTLGQLAAAEQVTLPTMSRIVAGLKRSRLVEIARDPQDARRMCIRATAKGVHLLRRARQRRIDYLAAHLDSLAAGELAQLEAASNILERLLQNWH